MDGADDAYVLSKFDGSDRARRRPYYPCLFAACVVGNRSTSSLAGTSRALTTQQANAAMDHVSLISLKFRHEVTPNTLHCVGSGYHEGTVMIDYFCQETSVKLRCSVPLNPQSPGPYIHHVDSHDSLSRDAPMCPPLVRNRKSSAAPTPAPLTPSPTEGMYLMGIGARYC